MRIRKPLLSPNATSHILVWDLPGCMAAPRILWEHKPLEAARGCASCAGKRDSFKNNWQPKFFARSTGLHSRSGKDIVSFGYQHHTQALRCYSSSAVLFNSASSAIAPAESPSTMVAEVIDGTAVAKSIRQSLNVEISEAQTVNALFKPSLTIIQVGNRPDSSTYVRMKLKAAQEANIICTLKNFSDSITEIELLFEISALNDDPSVHGILVQLPVPDHISESKVTNAVAPEKDVDGFGPLNVGELAKRGGSPLFVPCTPKGVMVLLETAGVELTGKNVVVLGRSDIVGSPVSYLLRNADATVTVCHSRTKALQEYLKEADVVVSAIGKPQFVKGEWLKSGVVVIDVGTNYIPDATKKSGQRLVGDVDFESASAVASKITPVPGGVGPMTVAMLLQNVVDAAKRYYIAQAKRHITPLPLNVLEKVPSDFEISRAQKPKHIRDMAHEIGITDSELELYGPHKAKVQLSLLDRLAHRKNGKYVLVTGITPTPLGEGKSTTTVGLVQALGAHLGKIAFANVRQPSMGPTFGIKGGAAGGGYSQVIPMDEFNMHLTGDIHAISAATNLLAAAIDTRMFHESAQKDGPLYKRLVPAKRGVRTFSPVMLRRLKKLGIDKTNPNELTPAEISKFARLDIDPDTITWRRVVDCNDRHLRTITIGQGAAEKGHSRVTGFDITVASECMAVLALSNSLSDMRERLGRMVVASSKSGEPITCDDIGCGGALTALMKDAIKPNLMQTLEGTPVFVHAGPFANISIGANSVLADKMALKLAGTEPGEDEAESSGYVVTEAGFDFTMGGERFFNIKCRSSGLVPDVVVIVATVRALKLHGGGPDVTPGVALPEVYRKEDVDLLRKGCANLAKHIANAKQYGLPVVVAINQFETDTEPEIAVIREEALKAGADDAILSNHWAEGGKGAVKLAESVIMAANKTEGKEFKLLYDVEKTVEEKLNIIAREMYGADSVELSDLARQKVETYTRQGFGNLPICVAKTQYSLSHDPALKGVPTGFTVPIRDVRASVGAGYLYALAAEIMTIPGLPTHSGFMDVEVSEDGEIEGLF
ncbi:formate--tetrahydrofolate ligase-domain-containing protein [Lipomyces doorenjongii]|uniref:formate--tetrahydrofolate ligase-domain-containing protein n=1 Tax=Lipomyces doorenjongii TaxID=383834 RepID=UPI0034CE1244